MCKGFLKIPRKVFDSDIWNEKRVFSRYEALTDLCQSADYKTRKLSVSFRSLADRWRWCLAKVQRFIKALSDGGFISVSKVDGTTVFTVFDTLSDTPNDTPNDTPKSLSTKGFSDVGDTLSDTPNDTPSDTLSRAYKNDNINIMSIEEQEEYIASSLRSEALSSSDDASKKKGNDEASEFLKFFNEVMDAEQSMICRVRSIKGQRLTMLNARIKESGKDAVFEVFDKAAKSSFLNGHGSRGFTATIDWLLRPNNFQKTLEGNYDNRTNNSYGTNSRTGHQTSGNPSDDKLVSDAIDIINEFAEERSYGP